MCQWIQDEESRQHSRNFTCFSVVLCSATSWSCKCDCLNHDVCWLVEQRSIAEVKRLRHQQSTCLRNYMSVFQRKINRRKVKTELAIWSRTCTELKMLRPFGNLFMRNWSVENWEASQEAYTVLHCSTLRMAVHGDGFVFVRRRRTQLLKEKNTANDMETRGFEDCDANRLLLDRFLEIKSFMETRANDNQGIWTHSEHQSQRTCTPREELQDKFVLDGRKNPILKKEDAMLNRSVSVRLACLTQDRLDLAETAQHLAQRMSEQREIDCVPLKCATRYRVGKPNDAIRCRRQGGC